MYGLLQNTVIPGFADALFLPLALARPRKAYRLALLASSGTLLGASVLFAVGANFQDALAGTAASWLRIAPAGMERVERGLEQYGWVLVLVSTVSPISTKLLAATAGVFGMPYLLFIGALGAGRIARTLVTAWVIRRFGAPPIERWLGHSLSGPDERAPEPVRASSPAYRAEPDAR